MAPVRLLVVGMPHSVHIVRALAPLTALGWDVHLFPSQPYPLDPAIEGVTFYETMPGQAGKAHRSVLVERRWADVDRCASVGAGMLVTRRWRARAAAWLAGVLAAVRPDLVHSHETQNAAYLVLDAKARLGALPFPP